MRGPGIIAGAFSFTLYYVTCFRTVTWWDSLNYTNAAYCLGVPGPPGSLVAVLLGWPITRAFPGSSAAFALNVAAALVASVTVVLVLAIARRLSAQETAGIFPPENRLAVLGLVAGALALAFSETLWLHATKYTPYAMTACLTAILVWQMIRWWETADRPESFRRLILIALLFGLDFSFHRTNSLLLPGFLGWILLRRPQVVTSVRVWLWGLAAFAVGLSFHLIIIPLSARQPYINFSDPSTFSRFRDYISLQQYGGGWLVNLWPRKAPFWDVQVTDYVKVFAANFLDWKGAGSVTRLLPTVLALFGLVSLARRDWRMAIAISLLFLSASVGAIVYFNIPADFFRPFDRHYLPSFIILGVLTTFGAYALAGSEWRRGAASARLRQVLLVLIVLALPASQILRNFRRLDGSANYIAHDFGKNLMATLPPDAIIFTFGDADTYPLWYEQVVEGNREDVTPLNMSLLNTPWYVRQMRMRDLRLLLTLTDEEIRLLSVREWPDTTITVAPPDDPGEYLLPQSAAALDSVRFHVPPALEGRFLLAQDWITLRIIVENRWRRPIYFSDGGYSYMPGWLKEHLRPEGLAWRLLPITDPRVNNDLLEYNLLSKYRFRGFADTGIHIDTATQSILPLYLQSFSRLALSLQEMGDSIRLHRARNRFQELIPAERIRACPGVESKLLGEVYGG